ncbi:protein LOL2 isoform X1 [Arachis ipaensis]|uniref:protein LOL2 isoform X1 n=1 Tax=Arachis ipaensis TaxID=130454 RepID=UPI0007AF5B43|nr:protein LOL2 isoform X1 [Arachis ipaensis]
MMQLDEIKTQREVGEDDDGPPPGWQPIHTPPPQPPPQSQSRSRSPPRCPSNLGQIVCGSCHRLLAYQRGAKHVQCVSCQTVNIVLAADQVGQVKCGGCAVLLMYPYGAPQVRCSSCRFVTEIGAHNKRPPWSEQQRKPTLPKTAC